VAAETRRQWTLGGGPCQIFPREAELLASCSAGQAGFGFKELNKLRVEQ
jgi:hypothetical protein